MKRKRTKPWWLRPIVFLCFSLTALMIAIALNTKVLATHNQPNTTVEEVR